MANRPLAYMLSERKANLGKMAGKTVIQARPTGRKRVDHRSFCDEVAHATTFTGAEVEAVLRLAADIAKKHVENGDIVDFGDIGTLSPSFHSKLVEKGKEKFQSQRTHNRTYCTLDTLKEVFHTYWCELRTCRCSCQEVV